LCRVTRVPACVPAYCSFLRRASPWDPQKVKIGGGRGCGSWRPSVPLPPASRPSSDGACQGFGAWGPGHGDDGLVIGESRGWKAPRHPSVGSTRTQPNSERDDNARCAGCPLHARPVLERQNSGAPPTAALCSPARLCRRPAIPDCLSMVHGRRSRVRAADAKRKSRRRGSVMAGRST